MGRKKIIHPSDILKKKEKRKKLRKIKKVRKLIQKKKLERLAPEKLLNNIKKLNKISYIEKILYNYEFSIWIIKLKAMNYVLIYLVKKDCIDEKIYNKQKNMIKVYKTIMKKTTKKKLEIEDKISVSGINRILGKQKQSLKNINNEAVNSNIIEFPPGLPRPIHLCFPPGIQFRTQMQLCRFNNMKNTKKNNYNYSNVLLKNCKPVIKILGVDKKSNMKNKDKLPEDFFDPFNPRNPFYQQNQKLKNDLQTKFHVKKKNFKNNVLFSKNLSFGPFPLEKNDRLSLKKNKSIFNDNNLKLEILLPDNMIDLKPTSISVKRYNLRKDKSFNSISKKLKINSQKKNVNALEYDMFLKEIEDLM